MFLFYCSMFFVHVLSCVMFGGGPITMLTICQGGPPVVPVFLYAVHKNFKILTSRKVIWREVKDEEEIVKNQDLKELKIPLILLILFGIIFVCISKFKMFLRNWKSNPRKASWSLVKFWNLYVYLNNIGLTRKMLTERCIFKCRNV